LALAMVVLSLEGLGNARGARGRTPPGAPPCRRATARSKRLAAVAL
jgi:hypothetical protein